MPCNEIHGRRGCPNEFHVHLLPAGPQGPKGESNFNITARRLAPYLYDVTYDRIPDYIPINPIAPVVGCTSFVRNGALFTNLDWNYSETAEFFIHTKCFEGMAFDDMIADGNLDTHSVRIGQLPYRIRDGRNENGIMVASHVLINDWGWHGSGSKDVPIHTLAYHVLNEVQSMDELQIKMAPYLSNIMVPESLDSVDYLMQFIVTDGTTTCAIVPPTASTGAYQILDISDNPKLANFRWVSKKTLVRNDPVLQLRPTGVERWNAIENNAALEDLRFTLAYEAPNRLSEFIGMEGTTKESSDEALITIYNRAHQAYLVRERDGLLWQTMHSVIYRPEWTVALYTQENYTRNHIQLVPTHLSELEDDATHRTVTDEEKAFWNRGASGGIPEGGEAGMVLAKRSGRDFDLYWRIISGRLADMTDDATHRLVTDAQMHIWNAKADIVDIPTSLSELSPDELHRLVTDAQIEAWNAKANFSDIPTALSQLTGDATHRLVTDTEKYIWNSKADADDIPTRLEQLYGDAYHRLVTDTQIVEWNGKADASAITAHNVSGTAHSDIRASVEDVREIAMGKSSNYAFSIVDNPVLNSLEDDIVVTGALVDIFGVSHPISSWKVSDNALIVEMNLPDRWYAGNGHFYRLETAKSSVTDITFKGSTVIQNGVGVLPSSLSLFDDDATHRLVTDAQIAGWNAKADASDIPTLLSQLSGDTTHRVVTDAQITAWNGKADKGIYQVAYGTFKYAEASAAMSAGMMVITSYSASGTQMPYIAITDSLGTMTFEPIGMDFYMDINDGTLRMRKTRLKLTATRWSEDVVYQNIDIIQKTLTGTDYMIPTSKAVKTYVDNALSGIPSAEKQAAWDAKADASDIPTSLADLTDDTNHRTVSDSMVNGWNGKPKMWVAYNTPGTIDITGTFVSLANSQTFRVMGETTGPGHTFAEVSLNDLFYVYETGKLSLFVCGDKNANGVTLYAICGTESSYSSTSKRAQNGIAVARAIANAGIPSAAKQAEWDGKADVSSIPKLWNCSSFPGMPNRSTYSGDVPLNWNFQTIDGVQHTAAELNVGDIIYREGLDGGSSCFVSYKGGSVGLQNLSYAAQTYDATSRVPMSGIAVASALSAIKPTYPLVSTLTGWNQAMHMGETTPNVTFPSPAASPTHEEEIRLTFIASSTNAAFTAPSGCVLTDGTDYASSIALTDLTVSCYYEVSAQVIGADYSNNKVIALVVKKWAEMEE